METAGVPISGGAVAVILAPSLAWLYLFDLLLVLVLVTYFRRFGHRHLKFGAMAVAAGGVGGLLLHFVNGNDAAVPRWLVPSMTSLVYGVLLWCAATIIRDSWRGRLPVSVAGLAWGAAVLAVVFDVVSVRWLPFVPGVLLLLAASVLVGWRRTERADGRFWLALVLVFNAVGLAVAGALDGGAGAAHLFEHLARLMTGAVLLVFSAERIHDELGGNQERLERIAEDRKRLEVQVSHARKLESLGVLAGGIAHDFNNMLTSILGYSSLAMKKLPRDSDVRKDLYMVMSGARQAVDLTSQMLTYAGKGALDFEAVDISRVVENLASLIHSIVPREIRVAQRLGRGLPSLRGDKVQVGQVAMNLIANAVDAIEDHTGVIEITTGLAEVDERLLSTSLFADEREPGAYLYLRVKDTGIGMAEEQVERIFDPFYSEKSSGKGLGLASLSGIVRQHKGFIRVVSAPGEGSEFTVYFPVVAITDDDRRRSVPASEAPRSRGRVLLADDDSRIRSLMTSILESDSFSLVSAEDGKEALSLYREHNGQFDLLVLDCTMPKMSGTELYRELRSEGVSVPVVLVSGYHQEQVIRNIGSDPQACFIKKPFNVDDFLTQIREILTRESVSR